MRWLPAICHRQCLEYRFKNYWPPTRVVGTWERQGLDNYEHIQEISGPWSWCTYMSFKRVHPLYIFCCTPIILAYKKSPAYQLHAFQWAYILNEEVFWIKKCVNIRNNLSLSFITKSWKVFNISEMHSRSGLNFRDWPYFNIFNDILMTWTDDDIIHSDDIHTCLMIFKYVSFMLFDDVQSSFDDH